MTATPASSQRNRAVMPEADEEIAGGYFGTAARR
jgi:hypothetical protein